MDKKKAPPEGEDIFDLAKVVLKTDIFVETFKKLLKLFINGFQYGCTNDFLNRISTVRIILNIL